MASLPAMPPSLLMLPAPNVNANATATASRSLRRYRYHSGNYYRNDDECFSLLFCDLLGALFFVMLVAVGISNCWWFCSPNGIARHRREKEEEARRMIAEFKQRRQQLQANNNNENNNGGSDDGDEAITYRVYECCYNGSTRGRGEGYGHAEMHLAISPSSSPSSTGRRLITGCGMRELEYTEIIDGHIDSNGNAEWTERTRREISYEPPPGYRDTYEDSYLSGNAFTPYLSKHEGPVSIRSIGKFDNTAMESFEGAFFGRDECNCNECKAFWYCNNDGTSTNTITPPLTLFGETVRWCPAEERRKIGEYILFRRKEEEGEASNDNGNDDDEEEAYHRMV